MKNKRPNRALRFEFGPDKLESRLLPGVVTPPSPWPPHPPGDPEPLPDPEPSPGPDPGPSAPITPPPLPPGGAIGPGTS